VPGDSAADAFSKCAEMNLKLNSRYDAASNYINAGTCLKKENVAGKSFSLPFLHFSFSFLSSLLLLFMLFSCFIFWLLPSHINVISESVRLFKRGIDLFTEEGRFTMAAKYQKEIAELCEAELDLQGAMDGYQTAADYYEGEGSQR
jgi:hypothetical protein